jgi:release factor glutamine methyltransferase
VLESIQRSAAFLTGKGVESPRLQAELLLAHLLKMPRMQLYLNFERQLAGTETDALREMVRRRGQREPLQHITGTACFCDVEVAVNRTVLVPRPETELLAELAWTFLNQIRTTPGERNPSGELRVLDFGAGSGCIAIVLGRKCSTARVWALERSEEALTTAQENAARCGVSDRIEFVSGDRLDALPAELQFDLIVSNPPYIPTAEIESLEPEVRDFDPRGALDGGPDGLDYYRRFAAEAGARLAGGGRMLLEFGDGQAAAIRAIFEQQNWVVESITQDYTQRPRIITVCLHGKLAD